MSRRILYSSYKLALVIGFVLSGATLVSAAGYWNVPGNYCQRCGCGYSGGYHAPFMLGPIRCDGWGPPNEVRLPYAPNPYGCCMTNDCYVGGNGCGCLAGGSTSLAGSVEAAPAVAEAEATAPPQALFEAPVQP